WHYLYGLSPRDLTLKQDQGGDDNVAISPDGKRLAIPAKFGMAVSVLDARTGQLLHTIKAHASSVFFSRDGKRLVVSRNMRGPNGDGPKGGGQAEVKVWDAQTGKALLTFTSKGVLTAAAFSPDGNRLASRMTNWDADKKTFVSELKVWDAQTG